MLRERESDFGRTEEEEKLKQIKAEAEVFTGGIGNEKAMEKAVERRKEKKVILDTATKFAEKRVEIEGSK